MSLNTIILDSKLLTDLYPDNLVETVTTTVPEKAFQNYLGHNAKKNLVFVKHLSLPYLPDDELNFLTNILAACKLGMADIAIVNSARISPQQTETLIETEGRIILLFGIEPSEIGLPIHFPPFQLQQFNKRTYLHSPSLKDLDQNVELKKQLWNSLRKLFGL